MSQEKVDLTINISGSWWRNPPAARVYLNNELLFDDLVRDPKEIKVKSVVLSEGNHTIRVELHRKLPNETVVQDGKIVKDQLLNIDEIKLDDIPLGYLLHQNSTYLTDDGKDVKNCVNLGWNGTWSFSFTVPVYIWLLENF